jgi:hypothetical protein
MTWTRRCVAPELFFTSCNSRIVLILGEFAGVERSRLRIACGLFMAIAAAGFRTFVAIASSRMRAVCKRICCHELNVSVDRLWMLKTRLCALCEGCSSSRTGRVCGQEQYILRSHPLPCPRPTRGHENLVLTRGRACPVLNMMRNTLPPSMFQFTMPGFKQSSDLLNLLRLVHCVHTDLSCELTGYTGWWYLPDRSGGVFVDAFTELLEHFHGDAQLGGGGFLHGRCQIRMPREGLWPHSCRYPGCLLSICSVNLATAGSTGCAHGLLKPSLAAVSSAAIFVGASTVVRRGSPSVRANSRSVW